MEQPPWVCPSCARTLSPNDTVVVKQGRPAHLDCQRLQVLSPEERLLLFAYCLEHAVAECKNCVLQFRMRELALDPLSRSTLNCQRCRRDLTDSIRDHFYGCAMVPKDVRRRAQAARETAQRLVKRTRELRDAADVLIREAEAALYVLREAVRQAPIRRISETESEEEWQIRPLAYHPLPMKLLVGDRFSDDTGEWEIVSPPRRTAGGKSVHTRVRGIAQPGAIEDRTWVANERIRVTRGDQQSVSPHCLC
jgi:hypothetical protein